MIKAILFDLDGVLVDACDLHYRALNDALFECAGIRISPREHHQVFDAWTTRQKLSHLNQTGRLPIGLNDEVFRLKQLYTQGLSANLIHIRGEHVLMLTQLINDYVLGCVSNCVSKSFHMLLDYAGLKQYFDVGVCNEDVQSPKPSPDPYIKALELLDMTSNEVIAFEDNEKGIESAESARIRTVRVHYHELSLRLVKDSIRQAENIMMYCGHGDDRCCTCGFKLYNRQCLQQGCIMFGRENANEIY